MEVSHQRKPESPQLVKPRNQQKPLAVKNLKTQQGKFFKDNNIPNQHSIKEGIGF
jgi:hypothetical protein